MWQNIKRYLIIVWPTINRIINNTIFFILSLIKTGVSYAIRQLKGDM